MPNSAKIAPWTETLVAFLRSEPGLEAVRVDPTTRKVAVATLGEVDEQLLRERLREVLERIEADLPVSDQTEPA
ncbi:MAG: hypothetical protein ACKVI3_06615, partial [Verrucomicrobiia bacterium]